MKYFIVAPTETNGSPFYYNEHPMIWADDNTDTIVLAGSAYSSLSDEIRLDGEISLALFMKQNKMFGELYNQVLGKFKQTRVLWNVVYGQFYIENFENFKNSFKLRIIDVTEFIIDGSFKIKDFQLAYNLPLEKPYNALIGIPEQQAIPAQENVIPQMPFNQPKQQNNALHPNQEIIPDWQFNPIPVQPRAVFQPVQVNNDNANLKYIVFTTHALNNKFLYFQHHPTVWQVDEGQNAILAAAYNYNYTIDKTTTEIAMKYSCSRAYYQNQKAIIESINPLSANLIEYHGFGSDIEKNCGMFVIKNLETFIHSYGLKAIDVTEFVHGNKFKLIEFREMFHINRDNYTPLLNGRPLQLNKADTSNLTNRIMRIRNQIKQNKLNAEMERNIKINAARLNAGNAELNLILPHHDNVNDNAALQPEPAQNQPHPAPQKQQRLIGMPPAPVPAQDLELQHQAVMQLKELNRLIQWQPNAPVPALIPQPVPEVQPRPVMVLKNVHGRNVKNDQATLYFVMGLNNNFDYAFKRMTEAYGELEDDTKYAATKLENTKEFKQAKKDFVVDVNTPYYFIKIKVKPSKFGYVNAIVDGKYFRIIDTPDNIEAFKQLFAKLNRFTKENKWHAELIIGNLVHFFGTTLLLDGIRGQDIGSSVYMCPTGLLTLAKQNLSNITYPQLPSMLEGTYKDMLTDWVSTIKADLARINAPEGTEEEVEELILKQIDAPDDDDDDDAKDKKAALSKEEHIDLHVDIEKFETFINFIAMVSRSHGVHQLRDQEEQEQAFETFLKNVLKVPLARDRQELKEILKDLLPLYSGEDLLKGGQANMSEKSAYNCDALALYTNMFFMKEINKVRDKQSRYQAFIQTQLSDLEKAKRKIDQLNLELQQEKIKVRKLEAESLQLKSHKPSTDNYHFEDNLNDKQDSLELYGCVDGLNGTTVFEERDTANGVDAGFSVLETNRDEVAQVLKPLSLINDARSALSSEIHEAIITRKFILTEAEELVTIIQNSMATFDRIITDLRQQLPAKFGGMEEKELIYWLINTSSDNDLKETGLVLQELESQINLTHANLMSVCEAPETFEAYADAYPLYNLPLGLMSATLYAREKGINLYIWKKADQNTYPNDTNQQCLELLHPPVISDDAVRDINILKHSEDSYSVLNVKRWDRRSIYNILSGQSNDNQSNHAQEVELDDEIDSVFDKGQTLFPSEPENNKPLEDYPLKKSAQQ